MTLPPSANWRQPVGQPSDYRHDAVTQCGAAATAGSGGALALLQVVEFDKPFSFSVVEAMALRHAGGGPPAGVLTRAYPPRSERLVGRRRRCRRPGCQERRIPRPG